MLQLAANRTWFNFSLHGEEPCHPLSVYAFSGKEGAHSPYEFSIELVSQTSNLDLTGLLGKNALLTIADRSAGHRLVHGIIRQAEQLHTANRFTHYRCLLVPRLWFLSQTQDHKIFQNMTVEKIIEMVLHKHHFTAESYSFNLRCKYKPREYCVQYAESDLYFISRICEEEGIFFYFEHQEDNHKLIFADVASGSPIPGENLLRFFPGSGQVADTAVVARAQLFERVNSNESTYREWNFTQTKLDLTCRLKEADTQAAPAPPGVDMETYQFPHLYQLRADGDRYADLQLQRQLVFHKWLEAEADVSRFVPGHIFTLFGHPRLDANRNWWVYSVIHEGKQPEVLEHEAPDTRGLEYISRIECLPDDVRFLPALRHPKIRIEGLQSAIVTGPPNEEVYTDEYGRVKVKFHWDRSGCNNEETTCWVRVADAWAGENFGFIQIPRIGQEVMVEFMEGDPDRPVITGRVYNASKMPPWTLPEQKPLSGIQSREFKANRKNQLILDDSEGAIQAQLSSDHGLSQLNLGYLTRINHVEGRKDFRGEGFELRTDDWGAIRAAKGLFITTDTRKKAQNHQKDMSEAVEKLEHASEQHETTSSLARDHNAQEASDASALAKSLHDMTSETKGSGEPHAELAKPHMLFSSPVGMAITTPNSVHIHTGENTAVSVGRHFSASTGKSYLVSALDKVSMFAHKLGMRIFAARGKVEIQAQSDELEIIAEKVIQIISAKEKVNITAAKEILLTAGGSYICINGSGIEEGTPGKWQVHASDRSMSGPKSKNVKMPVLPGGGSSSGAMPVAGEAPVKQSPADPLKKLTAKELAADPAVILGLETAWLESNPNAPEVQAGQPGSLKSEQGGWIVNNPDGSLGIERFEPLQEKWKKQGYEARSAIAASDKPKNAVGWFHTHPNTEAEGYLARPSQSDIDNTAAYGVPGIVVTHDGYKYLEISK